MKSGFHSTRRTLKAPLGLAAFAPDNASSLRLSMRLIEALKAEGRRLYLGDVM